MRIVVRTGTDVAGVAVADPSLLGDIQALEGRNHKDALRSAISTGALWRAETGADGAYLFHLFVDEDPPTEIQSFFQDPIEVERFRVPSGRLLVAGEEYVTGSLRLDQYPHMGSELKIPLGDYRLTAYRVEAPDDLVDRRLAEVATGEELRAWKTGSTAPGACVIGTLLALAATYFIYTRTSSIALSATPLALAAAGWLWCWNLLQRPAFRAAEKRFREIELEIPSIAIVMKRVPPEA